MAAVNFLTLLSYIDTLEVPIYDLITEIECNFADNPVGVGRTMNVYEAYLIKNNKKIKLAAKIPNHQLLLCTPDYKVYEILDSLRQEIRIMKHLADHPNIVDFYGMSFNELKPIVFVEFSIGSVQHYLEDKKEEGRPVDWPTKAAFCCDVADGLRALHAVGVVHGDIKADNVLLFPISENDSVDKLFAKIADFGYSATTASIGLGRGTGGTRNFYAPECTRGAPYEMQCFKDKAKKDNYMFGLFVWQVSKDGEIPYAGYEDIDIEKIKHEDKDLNMLLKLLPSNTPEGFRFVISKTTDYQPSDRIILSRARRILAKILDSDAAMFREIPNKAKEIFSINATELPRISKVKISSVKSMRIPSSIKQKIHSDFEKAASKNNAEAAFSLSICYEEAFGVEMDMDKAVEWIIKAAGYGSLEAMTKLANKYNIKELPVDPDIAFLWYINAAHTGSLIAQFKVSICYYLGIGVEKDIVKGDFWISKCGLAGLVNTLKAMGIYENDLVNTTLSFLLNLCNEVKSENTRNNRINTTKVLMADLSIDVVTLKIHKAVLNEHIGTVKHLVNVLGMDVNTKDDCGLTPLHNAALNGHINIAKFLVIELGVDVNIKDNRGLTPLHIAAISGNINMAKLLLAKPGADVNIKDNEGLTPLHNAALNGHINIAKFLVTELDADANIEDNRGLTPLHKAALNWNIDMVELLVVELNAVCTKDDEGSTPLQKAQEVALKGKINMMEFLTNEFDKNIGIEGSDALIKYLKQYTTLTHLNLEGLSEMKALTNLNLPYNRIGIDGALALAECLKQNTALTYLNLSWNGIGDEGVRILTEGLKQKTALTNLNLEGNEISDEGVRILTEGLKQNTALTNLNLSWNEIGDEGVRILTEGLKQNTVHINLNLEGNRGISEYLVE